MLPEEPPAKRRVQDFDLNDAYIEGVEVQYLLIFTVALMFIRA